MNIILLSGGSGKRLWPLSNDVRSKQFIKLFRKPTSEAVSLSTSSVNLTNDGGIGNEADKNTAEESGRGPVNFPNILTIKGPDKKTVSGGEPTLMSTDKIANNGSVICNEHSNFAGDRNTGDVPPEIASVNGIVETVGMAGTGKEAGTAETAAGVELESMVQRIYRQLRETDPDAVITIATSRSQVSALHNQLGPQVDISVEPCRRDTFAAIALATAYLHDVKHVPSEEAVVVCPVDPYVDNEYFKTVQQMYEAAKSGKHRLTLMGITPTYPSEKYGYISQSPTAPDGSVSDKTGAGTCGVTFTEKPSKEKAAEYIHRGALWNGGVFAYKLSYVLDKSKELLGTSDYSELLASYAGLKKISFDYAVVEKEPSIGVVRYSGTWKDLGTWNTLTEAMEESVLGSARLASSCKNVHVVNELGLPIIALGLSDVVISASPEGILVSDKEQSSYIKPLVEELDSEVKFAEKSWGSYRVLDASDNSLTIKVTLNPSHRMNYHSHLHRDEVWTVIAGSGRTIVDGMEQPVKTGDVITMAAGCKHTVVAGEQGLQLIEVQLGADISVSDKVKYADPF